MKQWKSGQGYVKDANGSYVKDDESRPSMEMKHEDYFVKPFLNLPLEDRKTSHENFEISILFFVSKNYYSRMKLTQKQQIYVDFLLKYCSFSS